MIGLCKEEGSIIAQYLVFNRHDKDPPGVALIEWYHRRGDTGAIAMGGRMPEYNRDDGIAMNALLNMTAKLNRHYPPKPDASGTTVSTECIVVKDYEKSTLYMYAQLRQVANGGRTVAA